MLEGILKGMPLKVATIGRGLGLVRRAAGGWTLAWLLLLVAQGLLPAAQMQLTRSLVNSLAVRQLGEPWLRPALWLPAGLIAFLWLGSQLLASVTAWVRVCQAERVQDHIHGLIQDQASALDLAFFEDPDGYDLLHRARVDAMSQPLALLESVGSVIQNGVTLVLVAILLAVYTPLLPLLLVASALPGLWFVFRHVLREHHWRLANTSQVRRAAYYDWMLSERNSAAELRLFELGGHHRQGFLQVRVALREGRIRLALQELKAEISAGLISWGGGLLGMGWMLYRLLRGLARMGDLVLCYQAFQQGQRLLRSLLESAGQIYRSTLFLENLFQFLAIRSSLPQAEAPVPLPQTSAPAVQLQAVDFQYPGSEQLALENFSLELAAGSVTAIVGHNGAGKSTLIKLLCRFYDPLRGRIRLDGVDLRDCSLAELRQRITVLFQEPVHYHASAGENIAMGKLATATEAKVRAAGQAAGAHEPIQRLEHGYRTMLGKWFGGAELSVGEWQRLALARAFLRDAPFIILDEPTSAMDSWAETDWLHRFKALTGGHTTLMITHRFTTARYADLIHVMDRGRIVESGSHEQLLAAGGRYAASWNAQMQEAGHG